MSLPAPGNPTEPLGQSPLYVTELRPRDVLLGRGSGSNEQQGNRHFRTEVENMSARYAKASNNRIVKLRIIQNAIATVRDADGRFLKKLGNAEAAKAGIRWEGSVYAEVLDEDTIIEKTRQTFRYILKRKLQDQNPEQANKRVKLFQDYDSASTPSGYVTPTSLGSDHSTDSSSSNVSLANPTALDDQSLQLLASLVGSSQQPARIHEANFGPMTQTNPEGFQLPQPIPPPQGSNASYGIAHSSASGLDMLFAAAGMSSQSGGRNQDVESHDAATSSVACTKQKPQQDPIQPYVDLLQAAAPVSSSSSAPASQQPVSTTPSNNVIDTTLGYLQLQLLLASILLPATTNTSPPPAQSFDFVSQPPTGNSSSTSLH